MARLSKTPNARPASDEQLPDGARPRRARDERAREIERLRAENIALREENHRLQMQVLGVYGAEDEASRLREIARVQTDAGDDVAALQAETVMLRRALAKVTEEAMAALGDLQERLRATPVKRAATPRPTRAETNGTGPRPATEGLRPDLARPAPAGAAPNSAFSAPSGANKPPTPKKAAPVNSAPGANKTGAPGAGAGAAKVGGSNSPVVKPIGPVNGSKPVPGQADLRSPRTGAAPSERPRPGDPRRSSPARRG